MHQIIKGNGEEKPENLLKQQGVKIRLVDEKQEGVMTILRFIPEDPKLVIEKGTVYNFNWGVFLNDQTPDNMTMTNVTILVIAKKVKK